MTNNFAKFSGFSAFLATALVSSWAMAASLPAEQATEMLARAQANASKCGYLSASQKDKLSLLAARAELQLANREPVIMTKGATLRGRTLGAASACSTEEKLATLSILQGAADAVSEASEIAAAASDSNVTNESKAKAPQQQADTTQPSAPDASPVRPLAAGNASLPGLRHYADMTATYFVASRCGTQGGRINDLYASIVAERNQLMSRYSAAQVSGALQMGKQKARNLGCS